MASAERDEALAKLDTIISILQLAFKEQIDAARAEIAADPVAAAILEFVGTDGLEAGELHTRVTNATKQSKRSIQRRLALLLAQGAIAQSRSGSRITYRSTNLM